MDSRGTKLESVTMFSWFISIVLLGCTWRAVLCDDSEVSYTFYSKFGTESFLPGKSCADIYQISKASRGRSGYYWIRTTSLVRVYCDMELECGGVKGGWMRIAYLDMAQGHSCPSPWSRIIIPGTSKEVCRTPDDAGCYSVTYSTHGMNYNKICGKVRGYQKGSTDAFHSAVKGGKSINNVYADGISITFGNPRKHVWTYAAGFTDDGNYPHYNCPCAHIPGPDPPSFVGDHYYCDSGDTGSYDVSAYYSGDVLWDGKQCHGSNNNCCTSTDMPWFFRQLARSVNGENMEVRNCHLETFSDEDTLVEGLELYVQ
ncbi:uncharacterized protein [Dysidea avara]|uniref:uncharacterized protein isoform X1 n=2 Tax=Dysidea avara TaxID=196820 RepID=UPI00332E425F